MTSYIHVAVCFLPYGAEFVEGVSMPHVTIRKGGFEGTLEEAAQRIEPLIDTLTELTPAEFQCTQHQWNEGWYKADNFMDAHNLLLDKIDLSEKVPRWLWRDSKTSDDPTAFIKACNDAVENHGTPWDGEERFNYISHMTKVNDFVKENDVLYRCGVAVFDGKENKGQLIFGGNHVLFKSN